MRWMDTSLFLGKELEDVHAARCVCVLPLTLMFSARSYFFFSVAGLTNAVPSHQYIPSISKGNVDKLSLQKPKANLLVHPPRSG